MSLAERFEEALARAELPVCPACGSDRTARHQKHKSGSQSLICYACRKTWTPDARHQRHDLKRKTFGALRVLSFAGTRDGAATWNCLCACGETSVVRAYKLETGETTSCGCAIFRIGKREGAPITVFSLARAELGYSIKAMSARVGVCADTWKRLEDGQLYERGKNGRFKCFLTRRTLERINALMNEENLPDLSIERRIKRFDSFKIPANLSVETRSCARCGAPFDARLDQIAQGNGRFCSRKCGFASREKRKTIPCRFCGVGVEVKASRPMKTTTCPPCKSKLSAGSG